MSLTDNWQTPVPDCTLTSLAAIYNLCVCIDYNIIKLRFQGLPNNIDAAVTWTDTKKTYFFKGNNYWKFDNQEPASGEWRLHSVV